MQGLDSMTITAILVLVVAVAAACLLLRNARNRRKLRTIDAGRREERAEQERAEQVRIEDAEQSRRAEAEALEAASMRMATAQQALHDAGEEFRRCHDDLVAGIHVLAKAGCDAEFQRRFGVTRPAKAPTPVDDPEVQEFLRGNYATLRDEALARATESLMEREVERRLADAAAQDGFPAGEAAATAPDAPEAENAAASAGETGAVAGNTGEAAAVPENKDDAKYPDDAVEAAASPAADGKAEPTSAEPKAGPETAGETPPEPPAEAPAADGKAEPDPRRAAIEDAVRGEFDVESVRTYLLAAISARYGEGGKPLEALPWPAFTTFSDRGYGELALCAGAPVYAQDAYREFAWKMFHTGKRAEKTTRGEYSWPASHGLGDGLVSYAVETPAGAFSATGPRGGLPLCEWLDCAWMRHDLEYQGALLEPSSQRSFFVNLEGLQKSEELRFEIAGDGCLAQAPDSAFFLNAVGESHGAFVGMSISNPAAAGPGEAPYEIVERGAKGFTLRMTQDARRYDADTYPQFVEVHLAWAQPPTPRPERIVRHVAF